MPQPTKGNTYIPNEIVVRLYKEPLPGRACRVFMYLCRKILGWRKKDLLGNWVCNTSEKVKRATISLETGIDNSGVSKALRYLEQKKYILRHGREIEILMSAEAAKKGKFLRPEKKTEFVSNGNDNRLLEENYTRMKTKEKNSLVVGGDFASNDVGATAPASLRDIVTNANFKNLKKAIESFYGTPWSAAEKANEVLSEVGDQVVNEALAMLKNKQIKKEELIGVCFRLFDQKK